MESESLKFIKNQKKTGEYENQLQLDKANAKKSKTEMIKLKAYEFNLKVILLARRSE